MSLLPKYKLLAVGSDMECFLTRKDTGKPFPVVGLLGGTKAEPLAVPELGAGYAVQEDNVMPEVNIPACSNAGDFSDSIGTILSYLSGIMGDKGFDLSIVPSMHFTPSQLKTPQAQEVGCEPDFNVWTRQINSSPKLNAAMNTLRTASAHVHVSFLIDDKPLMELGSMEAIHQREAVVKALDMFLAVPSIFFDNNTERRKLYGKAGAFRPKNYGIEHRVMSNFWITQPHWRQWVFNGINEAFAWLNQYGVKYMNNKMDYIREAINNNSTAHAAFMLKEMKAVPGHKTPWNACVASMVNYMTPSQQAVFMHP